jgi:hypothetical protein
VKADEAAAHYPRLARPGRVKCGWPSSAFIRAVPMANGGALRTGVGHAGKVLTLEHHFRRLSITVVQVPPDEH